TDTLVAVGLPQEASANACFVPGRTEVRGKHSDYAGGRSLIAAAERGFCAIAVPRNDATIDMTDARNGHHASFPLAPDLVPPQGHWSNYPMTVARRVARNFPGALRGATIALTSDLPPAAGMSSSSALIVMTFLLLSRTNNLPKRESYAKQIRESVDLAGYLGTIENGRSFGCLIGDRGVGTFGGSEDHTAILCSSPNMLGQFSYCPVRLERRVELSDKYTFALASSGTVAEKTGAAMEKYNRASQLASAAAQAWRQSTGRRDPHLAAAVSSAPDATDQIRNVLSSVQHADFRAEDLVRRFEHFYEESEQILPAIADVLDEDTVMPFGELVDRSQQLGADLLGNQVPETIALAAMARDLGAAAASAFGAGFGGSVWALVRSAQVEPFLEEWASRYATAFPALADEAMFFSSRPAPAAFFPGGLDNSV
ncbi:MAG: galactokinase family protein, partial [Pirellulales bacterium]